MLTSLTAWLDQQAEPQTDLTRSSGALGNAYGPLLGLGPLPLLPQVRSETRQPTHGRALSQELRVASEDRDWPRYVAGLFLRATRFDIDSASIAAGGQALGGPGGFLLPGDELGSLQVHASTRESALFGELQLPGPGDSSISLGGRAFRTELAYDATLRFLGQTTTGAPRTQERGFTPRLGLELPLGPRPGTATLYATVAGGYRFGGANFNPSALTPHRSDRLVNHELGLSPDKALRLDLAAFWIDWRDAQVSSLLAGAVPVIGVANVGRAGSRGIEAAWQWQTQLRLGHSFAAADGSNGRATLGHAWVGARMFDIEGSAAAPGYTRLDTRLALSRGPLEAAQIDNLRDVRGVAGAAVVNRPGVAAFTDWILVPPRRLHLSARHTF